MTDLPIQPIACVIGHPIAGNPTQFACERALAAAELDWRFLSLDVTAERLEDAIRGVRAMGFLGVMVGHPHREGVVGLCDGLSEQAAAAQQVDMIACQPDGQLTGHHLKSAAISDAIADAVPEPDARGKVSIAMLGDCPTMRAALRPLMQTDRYRWWVTEPILDAPHEGLDWREVDRVDDAIDQTTAIIIRGRQGAQPTELPESLLQRLSQPALVIDMAETTSTSPLARYALQQGLLALTRLDLLIMQATRALEIWTGHRPDESVVREAFEEFLEI